MCVTVVGIGLRRHKLQHVEAIADENRNCYLQEEAQHRPPTAAALSFRQGLLKVLETVRRGEATVGAQVESSARLRLLVLCFLFCHLNCH